jgi:hypothetical protein
VFIEHEIARLAFHQELNAEMKSRINKSFPCAMGFLFIALLLYPAMTVCPNCQSMNQRVVIPAPSLYQIFTCECFQGIGHLITMG